MKRKSIFIILAIVFISIISSVYSNRLLSGEQLRKSYKAIFNSNPLDRTRFTLDEVFKDHPVIVMASPLGEPEDFMLTASDGHKTITVPYQRINVEILDVLKGQLSPKIINISAPRHSSDFMEAFKNGGKFIMTIAPADYVSAGVWGTSTYIVFYVSDTDQVVPLMDDKEHNKLLGITVYAFKEMIKGAITE